MRVDNQSAFILHARPFRDTSMLVEFLTDEFGRVSAVVRGARGTGRSAKQRRGVTQPFIPLSVAWSGNTDLKTIFSVETAGPAIVLRGERLFSGLYVNELFTRLLQHYDENPAWFDIYTRVIGALASTELSPELVLRRFELEFLGELGFGIDLYSEGGSGHPIEPDRFYRFDGESGFSRCDAPDAVPRSDQFVGRDLLAIAADAFDDSARRAAKRLCRIAIASHLGGKPLKSRELFG